MPNYLECILLFIVVAGPALCQQDVLKDAKNWFTAPRQKVLGRLFDDGAVGGDLSTEVKAIIRTGDLSSLPPPIVGQIPDAVWTAVGAGPILSLPREEIINLMLHDHIAAPALQKRLQDILITNVSQANAIEMLATLKENNNNPSYREWLLLGKLGPPDQWTDDNIIAMKEVFNYLPMHLVTKISDTGALQTLFQQVILCLENGNGTDVPSSSCPVDATDYDGHVMLSALHSYLTVKLEGEPSTWQTYQFVRMNISAISLNLLTLVSDETFLARKQDIVTMLNDDDSKRDLIGRTVVTKLLTAERVKEMTDVNQVKTFLSSLGNHLGSLVYAEDLPNVAKDNSVIMASTKYNTDLAIRAGKLEAKTAETLIRRLSAQSQISLEDATTMGMPTLSMAPAALLSQTVANMNATMEELALLVNCVVKTGGPGAKGKLRVLAGPMFALASASGELNLSSVPSPLLGLAPIGALDATTSSTAFTLLWLLPSDTDPALIKLLISKVESNKKADLDPNSKGFLTLDDLKPLLQNSDSDTLEKLTRSMPASSVLGKMVVVEALGQNSTIEMDVVPKWLMPFFGAEEVSKIPNEDILIALAAMKDTQPTVEACNALKRALVSYYEQTIMAAGDDEVFALLTPSDIEDMPPCVMAQFGTARLQSMEQAMKVLLMQRVVALGSSLFTATSIPQRVVKVILKEGIEALTSGAVVTVADVKQLGVALIFTPPNVIRAVTPDAVPLALAMLNELATTPLMPCLDHDTLKAVRSLMLQDLGSNPSQWSSVTSVCCLLPTLSPQQLNSIIHAALAICSCNRKYQDIFRNIKQETEAFCKNDLAWMFTPAEEAAAAVTEAQVRATLSLLDPSGSDRRKKRATSDISACTRAAVSGVDAIEATELESLPTDDVVECLTNLGSRDMNEDKAAILALKVPQSVDPSWFSKLSAKNLSDMGFILKGIHQRDIPGLPGFTHPAFNDVIFDLGKPVMKISATQLSTYATKVIQTWKSPINSWTGSEVVLVNRLLCAFNTSDIEMLSTDSLKQALPSLGQSLAGCELNTTIAPLAIKAEVIYGPPASWNKATVQEMGVVFAGVSPEKVANVPASAMAGLTPVAAKLITNDVAKVMTYQQIENFPDAVLPGLGSDKKIIFGDELARAKRDLLHQLKGSTGTVRRPALPFVTVLLLMAIYSGRLLQ